MVGPKAFTVELKCALLEYLIEQAEEWDADTPDIRVFWHTIERDFDDAKGTTWHGKDFEQKMEREEEAWLEECEDKDRKRRRGHEPGSNYDRLMIKWCAIWNGLLRKHWQHMVDTKEEKFDLVPDWVKKHISRPKPVYEYDGAKLERVVQAAMERAREAGKHDLSQAVEQVYKDALRDDRLRSLLEAILTQKADAQMNEEFQSYVKLAKAKIKALNEKNAVASSSAGGSTGGPPPSSLVPAAATTAPAPAQVATPSAENATTQRAVLRTVPATTAAPSQAAASAPVAASATQVQVVALTQTQAAVSTQVQVVAPPAVPTVSAASVPSASAPASSATLGASSSPSQNKQTTAPGSSAQSTAAAKTTRSPKGKGKAAAPKAAKAPAKLPGNPIITQNAPKAPVPAPAPAPAVRYTQAAAPHVEGATRVFFTANKPTTEANANAFVHPNPEVSEILGDLQFTATAQQILKAGVDITAPRLETLKTILISEPSAKTDMAALLARLEKENSAGGEPQASAGASRPARSNAGKKRRMSAAESSMAEAEEDDLLEAQRAAKRRRGEDPGEDDGGDYHPLKAVREKSKKKSKKGAARPSRSSNSASVERSGSSSLSELSDEMDIESTKSAYVEELVQRQSAKEAQTAITEQYGPVSPTIAGEDDDEDWASMASPTLNPMPDLDLDDDDRVPSPPPEPAALGDAMTLFSGAAAAAVASDPGIGRLEAKLDSLISITNPGGASSSLATNGQMVAEMNVANTETLKNIASTLRGADMQTARPEMTRLLLQLTQNAAEASIHAAEAAKRAAEMARDVALVLKQLGGGVAGDHPATPLSEN